MEQKISKRIADFHGRLCCPDFEAEQRPSGKIRLQDSHLLAPHKQYGTTVPPHCEWISFPEDRSRMIPDIVTSGLDLKNCLFLCVIIFFSSSISEYTEEQSFLFLFLVVAFRSCSANIAIEDLQDHYIPRPIMEKYGQYFLAHSIH